MDESVCPLFDVLPHDFLCFGLDADFLDPLTSRCLRLTCRLALRVIPKRVDVWTPIALLLYTYWNTDELLFKYRDLFPKRITGRLPASISSISPYTASLLLSQCGSNILDAPLFRDIVKAAYRGLTRDAAIRQHGVLRQCIAHRLAASDHVALQRYDATSYANNARLDDYRYVKLLLPFKCALWGNHMNVAQALIGETKNNETIIFDVAAWRICDASQLRALGILNRTTPLPCSDVARALMQRRTPGDYNAVAQIAADFYGPRTLADCVLSVIAAPWKSRSELGWHYKKVCRGDRAHFLRFILPHCPLLSDVEAESHAKCFFGTSMYERRVDGADITAFYFAWNPTAMRVLPDVITDVVRFAFASCDANLLQVVVTRCGDRALQAILALLAQMDAVWTNIMATFVEEQEAAFFTYLTGLLNGAGVTAPLLHCAPRSSSVSVTPVTVERVAFACAFGPVDHNNEDSTTYYKNIIYTAHALLVKTGYGKHKQLSRESIASLERSIAHTLNFIDAHALDGWLGYALMQITSFDLARRIDSMCPTWFISHVIPQNAHLPARSYHVHDALASFLFVVDGAEKVELILQRLASLSPKERPRIVSAELYLKARETGLTWRTRFLDEMHRKYPSVLESSKNTRTT